MAFSPVFPPDTKGRSSDAADEQWWTIGIYAWGGTSDLSLGFVDELMTAVLTESQQDMAKPVFEHSIVMSHAPVYSAVSKAAI